MPKLENKQKIIIGIILFIMIGVIIYYCYTNLQETREEILISEEESQAEQQIEETEQEETKKETEEIIIHIAGAVQKEGILKMEEGSRVADAIEKAGGLKENASTKNVNLAYMIEDGQKIYIPTIEEDQEDEIAVITSGEFGENETKEKSKIVNINTATIDELQEIPGIGESTAQKIITYRKENGKFTKIEDLKNVSGIGEAKFNQMKEYISI